MNQVLVQAGLIASENQIQAELVQSALAQAGLSTEKQNAILMELGLMDVTTGEILTTQACTKEELLNMLATKSVTGANAEAIISALGLTGANTGLAVSFELLGKAIRSTLLSLATNPLSWIFGIVVALYAGSKAWESYIHRLDNAKEALNETTSELDSVKSEIAETNSKIKELESLESLSITDKEDLERLREQNKELAIRQKYLEMQQQEEKEKVFDYAKDEYNRKYGNGETSKESVEKYKKHLNDSENTAVISNSSGTNPSQTPNVTDASDLYYESDIVTMLIAQYESYAEKKKEAIQNENAEDVEKYDKALQDTSLSIQNQRNELQGLKEDLSVTGESSAELDNVNQKLKMIDTTLLTPGQNLVNFINSKELSDDKQKLVKLAESGKLTSNILKENFSEVDDYLKENGLTLEDLISILGVFKEELGTVDIVGKAGNGSSISSTINSLNTKLKPAMDSLASAWQNIFPDNGFAPDNVDVSMLTSIKSTVDELNKLDGINIDYSSFDNLSRVLTDTDSKASDIKTSMNDFATSILYGVGATKELDSSQADLVTTLLESMGITNAQEIVSTNLEAQALKSQILAAETVALADKTDFSVIKFLEQAGATEVARNALFQLVADEQIFNNSDLNAKQKIEELEKLATAYGQTAITAKIANMEKAAEGAGYTTAADYDKELSNLQAYLNNVNNITVDFSGLKNSASKAGTESGKSYKDALKDELSDLNDVIGGITDIIDDQIDTFNDQKDAAVDALEAQKEAAEKALQAEKDAIQEQIDAKQDEIDKIKEAQEERKNDMELQKAQYDLERMQNQKSRFLFNGEQMTYDTDITGIRDAREQVTQAQENIRVASIEKEISGLEDVLDSLDKKIEASNNYYDSLIEQTEQYWNGLIKGLEDYKSRWTELAEMEDQAKILAQLEQMGISTSDILGMSEATFQNFKTNYIGILTKMYSGSNQMLASLSEVANVDMSPLSSSLEGAKAAIDEFGNADVSKVSNVFDAVTTAVNDTANAIVGSGGSSKGESGSSGNADTGFGSSGGSKGTSLKSAIEEQTESAIQNLTKEKELFNGEDGLTSAVQDVITKIGNEDSKNVEKKKDDSGEGTDLISAIQGQYDKTMELVPEQSEKFLTLADSINQCVSALKEMISLMQEVSTVPTLPSGEVTTVHTSSSGISHGGGGKAFTTSTNSATLRGIKLFEELTSQGSTHRNIETHAQAFNRNVSTISTRNIQPSFTMTGDVNVTCPGVTSQAVMKEVGVALKNEFSGFALEAYQKSHITR